MKKISRKLRVDLIIFVIFRRFTGRDVRYQEEMSNKSFFVCLMKSFLEKDKETLKSIVIYEMNIALQHFQTKNSLHINYYKDIHYVTLICVKTH